ncbi:hypothetical protein NEOLEDRAFT_838198 [Neolentinus lepideus HHB14362 ss-1]|uniref:Uncharacterized protein n=1 Tax=Neolentinus lepideus HHB14362 ss-1 TaxID=1314782 RepID=A0A165P6C4_9AGAM|nr:hypothetical protein NEOLEDRAFT_838198 [Neolentinus lepideus HHB14362 ss-1]
MSTSTNHFMIDLLSRLSPPSPVAGVPRSAASTGASWRAHRSPLVSAAERVSASLGGLLRTSQGNCARFLRLLHSTAASRPRSRQQSLASPPSFKHIQSHLLPVSLLHDFLADSDIVMAFGTPVDILVFGLVFLLLLVCAAVGYVLYDGWTSWSYARVDTDEEVLVSRS